MLISSEQSASSFWATQHRRLPTSRTTYPCNQTTPASTSGRVTSCSPMLPLRTPSRRTRTRPTSPITSSCSTTGHSATSSWAHCKSAFRMWIGCTSSPLTEAMTSIGIASEPSSLYSGIPRISTSMRRMFYYIHYYYYRSKSLMTSRDAYSRV
jgi:hypothetical protein